LDGRSRLADRALLSLNTVEPLETAHGDPRMSTVSVVNAALEGGGVEFLPATGGEGEG